jgi:simple sugar transport system permease protein
MKRPPFGAALRHRLAWPLITLALLLVVNTVFNSSFLHIEWRDGHLYGSLIDILNRAAPLVLVSLGMTMVIATRGIDISVGAVVAIAAAVAAWMIGGSVAGTESRFPLPFAILGAIGVAALCGLWNGVLVAKVGMQPIIATLILMVAGRGLAQLITEGTIVTFADPVLIFIGTGSFLGLPMPVVIALVLAVLATLAVRRTALGLLIEAVGVNRSAARFAGISSRLLLLVVYSFAGFCAAIAGLIVAGDIRGADANNAGLWLELDAILAVVIGGTSLLGGRFSIPMAVMGALIIQAMNTGILISGFSPEFNLVVKAGVIILILMLQSPFAARLLPQKREKTAEKTVGPAKERKPT